MSLTDYHAKYIAFELTRRFPSDSPERLAGAVASAQVDLNPHQVDAALFAFASPLSKGALLADEVGLGKTIEAGLVLSQRWAERRRRILVITPSNLRKQWREIADLDAFARLAASFDHNAKGRALLKALGVAFAKAKTLGAPEKAIIFTESRRTQSYLLRLLADSPHPEGIVLFNGSNTDERSRQLFEGVFGASDEVLGAIESGVDFEKRIAAIYQRCRRPEEIKNAFDQLQLELSFEIDTSMAHTRAQLLENFDDEVREKLRVREETAKASLTRYERLLMQLTRHELTDAAEFLGDASFRLHRAPPDTGTTIPLGLYELPRRSGEALLYRLNHPLAEARLAKAKGRDLPPAEIRFDYGRHPGKISLIEPLIGRSGWLMMSLFRVESLDQGEDHLIFAAVTDDGEPLDPEVATRLMTVPGSASPLPAGAGPGLTEQALGAQTDRQRGAIERQVSERNARFFEAEAQKLDGWADDLKVGLEREIKEMDRQIREARRAASAAVTLEEKLVGQRQVKALEGERSRKRRSLFDAQDEVDRQRDRLIAETEAKLAQARSLQALFSIRWSIQ